MFTALADEVPEVISQIKRFFALGAVVYLYESDSIIVTILRDTNLLTWS